MQELKEQIRCICCQEGLSNLKSVIDFLIKDHSDKMDLQIFTLIYIYKLFGGEWGRKEQTLMELIENYEKRKNNEEEKR